MAIGFGSMFHIFLIGAFTNRFIRGGDFAKRSENFLAEKFPKHEKLIKKIISADFLNFLVFTFTMSFFYGFYALLVGAAMWVGAQPTWGQYMAAIVEDYKGEFNRNKIFDFIPNKIKNKPLAGFVGMTLRGLFWGGLLSAATMQLAPLLAGLVMGVVYFLAGKFTYKLGFQKAYVPIAEFVFGGLLWLASI